MISLNLLMVIAGIHVMAVAAPGPDFLLVAHNAIFGSRQQGLMVSIGIALANAVHIQLVLILGSFLSTAAPSLLDVIRVAGALYLGYLGTSILMSLRKDLEKQRIKESCSRQKFGGIFSGFMTSILNPKALLYFLGIFSQFITPEQSATTCVILVTTVVGITFCWFSLVSIAVSYPKIQTFLEKYQRHMSCATAGTFLFFSSTMLFSAIG